MATLSKDRLSFGEIIATGDGVKTIAQLLLEIMAQITSLSQFKESSYIIVDGQSIYRYNYRTSAGRCYFTCTFIHNNAVRVDCLALDFSDNTANFLYSDGSIHDESSYVITSGNTVEFYF